MPDLYLYDADFDASMEKSIAKAGYRIPGDNVLPIKDWGHLAKAMMHNAEVGQLVLCFHSFDGGMLVGSEGRTLSEESVSKLFTKRPKIRNIAFTGCNVGNRPDEMAAFARMFKAETVSGYTWSTVKQLITATFPKGTREEAIKKTLAPFEPYIAGALPAANVLATNATHKEVTVKLVGLYGSADGETASAMPIPDREGKNRKPWKSAKKREINASEVPVGASDSPVVPFELVTVKF